MTDSARRAGPRLGTPIVLSAALHLSVLGVLALKPSAPALPPLYEVNLIAAPAGERRVGTAAPVTNPSPAATPEASPPAPRKAPPTKSAPATKAAPTVPAKATPAAKAPPGPTTPVPTSSKAAPDVSARPQPSAEPATKAPAAPAGGGPTGDKGTDVATVRTDGTAFPFPGYLQNIVRQIALNFRPRSSGALRADVAFLIHRDGSVSNVRFVTRSGAYAFDLEAQGAIEAAARSRAFGPLPAGFPDDVLPVTFSFDPRLVR